jgi:hypothetical protein
MILPKERDPRFITRRRGGSLSDGDHYLLAIWAARCAEHVLPLFETAYPGDERPRRAIEASLAWARREIRTTESKVAAYHANVAARDAPGAAKFAALAAGQAAVVAHVAAHELGAAAYAIRAVMAAGPEAERKERASVEGRWQLAQLPLEIRELVMDDERLRNELCWRVFEV